MGFDRHKISHLGRKAIALCRVHHQEAVKTRAAKKEIEVNKFWILGENETQSYIKCTDFQSLSEKNGSYSEKNYSLSTEKPPKVKKNKVKKNKVKETIETSPVVTLQNIIDTYQNNIAPLTPIVLHAIEDWLDAVDADMIEWAIKEAAEHNKRNWKYIEGILYNHFNAGHTTLAAVQEAQRNFKRSDTDLGINKDDNLDYDELEK